MVVKGRPAEENNNIRSCELNLRSEKIIEKYPHLLLLFG